MDSKCIDILDAASGMKKAEELFGKKAPDGMRSFAFPEDGGWTAVYIPYGGGEWFCEGFETKAQAMLYLTCNDLSPEEIRKDFAPEPNGVFRTDEPVSVLFEDRPDYTEQVLGLKPVKKRKVWSVTVQQTTGKTFAVEADTLQEARDAVFSDWTASTDEGVVDWSYELDHGEIVQTDICEGGEYDPDSLYEIDCDPDLVVKDGRLVRPS